MGRLLYGDNAAFSIDDGLAECLRVAMMNKLRRGEPFMLTIPTNDGTGGRRSLWFSPSIPHSIEFDQPVRNNADRELVERMLHELSSSDGLNLEPYLRS